MSVLTWVLAAAPLFEVELRWVEQAAPPPGSLSTAGVPGGVSTRDPGVRRLGPVLRVAEGATARWSLQLPGAGLWLQGPERGAGVDGLHGPTGARAVLPPADGAAWAFEARPYRDRQGRLQVALRWQQPAADGAGSQQWHTELPVAEGRWTTVARRAPPPAPADGTLRTQAVGDVQELQVRVHPVPE